MKLKALRLDIRDYFQHRQVQATYKEIRRRYYWIRDDYKLEGDSTYYDENKNLTTLARALAEHGLATLPHSISSFKERLAREIALDHLLSNRPAPELPARTTLLRGSHNVPSHDIPPLHQLFSSLRAASSFQREYIARLGTSEQCLHMEPQMTCKVAGENRIEALKKHFVQCRVNYLDSLAILKKSLGPTTNPNEQFLDQLGQWPPITADVLLRYLASTSPIDIPLRWKKCLISLALLLSDLQRARRLLRFALDGLEEEFSKELENEGCDGWNPEEYPDWLLIQVRFLRPSACVY